MTHPFRAIARRFWSGGFVGAAPTAADPDDREALIPGRPARYKIGDTHYTWGMWPQVSKPERDGNLP
jgi:hypothetical protein